MPPKILIKVQGNTFDVAPASLEVPGEPYELEFEVRWLDEQWSSVTVKNFRLMDENGTPVTSPEVPEGGVVFKPSGATAKTIRFPSLRVPRGVIGFNCKYDIEYERKGSSEKFILDPEIEFKPLYVY